MSAAENVITDNLPIWSSTVQRKSSAGRGSSSKRKLYGVEKLRELILDLAICGLLVPQIERDNGSEDLASAIEQKTKMIKDGIAKPTRGARLGECNTDVGQIPSSWETCLLEEVAWPQAGYAFPSQGFNQDSDGLPLIRIRDVGAPFSGTYFNGEFRREFLVQTGDTLISMDGDFRVRFWQGDEALLNQRVTRVFFPPACDKSFFKVAIQRSVTSLQGKKSYTTVDHLSTKQIASSLLPFPPLAEQHRIVAKLDELMALCDTLEQQQEDSIKAHETLVEVLLNALTSAVDADAFQASWQRISDHFDVLFTTEHSIGKFKDVILQLAVMGKLVPQDSNDEPSSILLEKIAVEKDQLIFSGIIKTKKNATGQFIEGVELNVPASWISVCLDQVTAITGGKRVSKGYRLKQEPTDFVYIRVTDMKNGTIDDSNLHYIDYIEREKIKRYIIQEGDIYMTIVGATIGKCGIVPAKFHNMNLTENAARIKVVNGINNKFLYLTLCGKVCQRQFSEKTNKVGVEKMALSRLGYTRIPLPPRAEQTRIVAKVDELMALCDQLAESLQQAQQTQIHLTDALVENAL